MEIATATDFGTAVRAERTRLGFSQDALAVAAGVGSRFIVELERGKPSAQLEKALAVAQAVGLTITLTSADHVSG